MEKEKGQAMRVSGPLFKWFGSKWLSSKSLPQPKHESIVEPFAGGAGYSLRHCDKQVLICENNPHLYNLWVWLISFAHESDIKDIPINIPEGTDIRTLGLNNGQQLLLKNWQRTNNVGNCWTISPWGNKPGQWTANTRARVASEFSAISHWKVAKDGCAFLNTTNPTNDAVTWFIDPPYQYNYQYGGAPFNYAALGISIQSLPKESQIVVCEARCPKTDMVPNWLPFTFFGNRVTSRRKKDEHHHSKELIWLRG